MMGGPYCALLALGVARVKATTVTQTTTKERNFNINLSSVKGRKNVSHRKPLPVGFLTA
jgi:hypothetical protein